VDNWAANQLGSRCLVIQVGHLREKPLEDAVMADCGEGSSGSVLVRRGRRESMG